MSGRTASPAGDDRGQDLHADERANFMATMGFDYRVEGDAALGRVTMDDYLCTGERWPGSAAILTFADVLIGILASHRTAPRISVTANLAVHLLAPLPPGGELVLTGRLAKAGQTMSVGETEVRAAGSGELLAMAAGTFLASPRPQDVATGVLGMSVSMAGVASSAPTLADHVGLRDLQTGAAEITLRPDLFNATESLQGGLVALLGERAAQTAATAAFGEPAVVHSLEVYYLAAARVGPFRATATSVEAGVVRVEIRDAGRDGRVVALVVAGARPYREAVDPGR